MPDDELPFWLALWRIPGIGPAHVVQAVQQLSSVAVLFKNPKTAIAQCGFSAELAHALANPDWQGVEADLAWAAQPHHHILTYAMPGYPAKLREISNAPPLLFVHGDITLLERPQLAMVGSRNPTVTGSDTAHQFAKTFASAGLIVTSGLALGIDAACHEGALAGQGNTIAVMGTGPDCVYPKRHVTLAKKIAAQGAIITEFPTGVAPIAANFPRRNRIISGLSLGVLVVEAAYGSGSLITANYALEQNREVFAIPGSIHNPLARGCHALIKQGAKLVETAQDVLEELHSWSSLPAFKEEKPSAVTLNLPKEQLKTLAAIGDESTPVDLLIQRTGLTAETVSSILLLLELEGHIIATPGGYSRIR